MRLLQFQLAQMKIIMVKSDLPVNFGGVTFFPEDYIYADLTGIILSQEALDLEDVEEE